MMKNKRQNRNLGFTLAQVLVVMSGVALVSSVGFVSTHIARTNDGVTLQKDAKAIQTQIDLARDKYGETLAQITGSSCSSCPFDHVKVIEKGGALENLGSDYLRLGFEDMPKDPWGTPYLLQEEEMASDRGDCATHDQIYSAGPDGIFDSTFVISPSKPGVVTHAKNDDYVFSISFFSCS